MRTRNERTPTTTSRQTHEPTAPDGAWGGGRLMSMFQCEHCGCAENTALTGGHLVFLHDSYDFSGIEDRKGKRLCSACTPTHFASGKEKSGDGVWHGKFERAFLPMGEFFTNREGNLEHKKTGDVNYRKMAIRIEQ